MTWGIWQIFSRALKIGILMGSFNPNLKKYELKIHRGVICHDNEELRKIWRGTDLSFQSWHEEFDEFWPEHLKVSKIFILMGSFWAKYILLKLKKYRWVIFHETEEGCKIWRGINLSFQNWHKKFDKVWPENLKVSKIFILMGSFWAKYIFFGLKKVQLSYLSWKWRGIQNLERNWLAVLIWALESLKHFHFNSLLLSNLSKVYIV